MTILSSNFIGSPRNLKQNYLDAMTLVQKFGKPDLFITIICNPNWKEINENLKPYETAIDKPDIVIKVFQQKVKGFKDEVIKKGILGKVIAYSYVIEFIKRGLPNMHIILFLNKSDKYDTPEKVDKIIKIEITNENINPKLYSIVK